jgi:hypothetical protein
VCGTTRETSCRGVCCARFFRFFLLMYILYVIVIGKLAAAHTLIQETHVTLTHHTSRAHAQRAIHQFLSYKLP